jgi:hypothetical protein
MRTHGASVELAAASRGRKRVSANSRVHDLHSGKLPPAPVGDLSRDWQRGQVHRSVSDTAMCHAT